jgi:hypothetical protein
MNHLQIYKHVQEDIQSYSYELRAMMRAFQQETDTHKCQRELEILMKFVNAKIIDESKMDFIQGEQLSQYLLGHTIED